jgi:hypothetical protein
MGSAKLYKWHSKYGGMNASTMCRLKFSESPRLYWRANF